jgi:D-threonate/D-erythronate kinase
VLGIIADDLTGAGDASVQFAKRGWRTLLTLDSRTLDSSALDSRPLDSGLVLSITTDCRALGNEVAQERTAEALRALMNAGIDRIFLKIDSTMRGSVPGQIAGALSAWRHLHSDARAFVCPAYPLMGRTVESGRLLVNGDPVERTPFGSDPVTPVKTSHISELLPDAVTLRTFDAATDADLMKIAESISAAGPAVIPVGSGGLAEAVAEVWSGREESVQSTRREPRRRPAVGETNPRILLQVSSLNPVSHNQVVRLKAVFPDVVVLSTPDARGDSAAVAADLAREFAARLKSGKWDVLGMIGGDGARETLRMLGASGIRIIDSLIEGVPHGVIEGGEADQMPVFTKAGGFGAEDALVRCVERIRA